LVTPLVSPTELAGRMRSSPPSVLDVRWSLSSGPDREAYEHAHIPGAVFVDLDHSLAAPPGRGGRHPLPSASEFTAAMQASGVSDRRAVVVYDEADATAAARAWWLLRYFGHPDVAVLEGGLAAWMAAGHEVESATSRVAPGDFVAHPGGMPVLDAAAAADLARRGRLVDARAPERYRGEREPIDPVAGRIPGAVNRPTTMNLDPAGRFLDGAELRAAFATLGLQPGDEPGAYCGSGVTAAHEVLALELAGYRAGLYAGSWSEWITDPRRPVERG
jgi:thiosulfate/3-mercaptopyruvate sulfurtransferase